MQINYLKTLSALNQMHSITPDMLKDLLSNETNSPIITLGNLIQESNLHEKSIYTINIYINSLVSTFHTIYSDYSTAALAWIALYLLLKAVGINFSIATTICNQYASLPKIRFTDTTLTFIQESVTNIIISYYAYLDKDQSSILAFKKLLE